jgi:probable HAF family extracellular repeat protein
MTLTLPPVLVGQTTVNGQSPHHHYKLIDLGTLGGPSAYKSVNAPGYQILTNAGEIAFAADTPMPDPFSPNCYNPDCFVTHATQWKNGVLTDLGALGDSGDSSASGAINARGWIVGQSEDGEIDPISGLPEIHATLWHDGRITDLGTFDGHWSIGLTLNDAGDVVGFATNSIPDPFALFPPAGTQSRAFRWRKGELSDLGTLGGDDAQAVSVNRGGQIVGISYTDTIPNDTTGIPTVHPFLWERGRMADLGTLGGTYAGGGSCNFGASCTSPVPQYEGSLLINNRSQVIGTSNLAGDQCFHPFLWEKGKMRDLGTLGGDNGVAIWLTDNGEVVGQADVPGSQAYHGFRWKDRVITDLGTLEGDPCSRALMANSKGQIVGGTLAICQLETTRAFLWENGGPIIDLNSLTVADSGANLYEADNINERGEIVASGLPAGCKDRFSCGHVYLLIPCDENHSDVEGCDSSMVDANEKIPGPAFTQTPASRLPSAFGQGRPRFSFFTNRPR